MVLAVSIISCAGDYSDHEDIQGVNYFGTDTGKTKEYYHLTDTEVLELEQESGKPIDSVIKELNNFKDIIEIEVVDTTSR